MAKNSPKRTNNPSRTPSGTTPAPAGSRPPLLWTGILFAFAANVLGVNGITWLLGMLSADLRLALILTLFSSFLIGMATSLYTRQRAGMHAFIGGLFSIPVLAFTAFGGQWQPAIICGALCGMGGMLAEVLQRRRIAPSS